MASQTTVLRQPWLDIWSGESVPGMAARPVGYLQESGAKTDVVHLERVGADPRSTCSHCVICCHCVMTSGSSPSTSIAPPNAAAAAHPQSTSDVELWLDILVQEVEKLATLLSEAVLRAAATRLQVQQQQRRCCRLRSQE